MIVADIVLRKMDHTDPRYPDPTPERPFSDVYLMSVRLDDGGEYETAFFVTGTMTTHDAMNPHSIPNMLKWFAKSVADMKPEQKAA